jgi:hypothetical protein
MQILCLNAVEKRHAIVRAFRVRHSFAGTGQGDNTRDSIRGALFDGGMHALFERVVAFLSIDAVRDCAAGTGRIHGGN